MSIEKNMLSKRDSINAAIDRFWADKTLVRSQAFIFPHLGALKESLDSCIILYNNFCPNEDCCYFNEGLEGIVLNSDADLFWGTQFGENVNVIYILWCCSRCAWAFIERKNSL